MRSVSELMEAGLVYVAFQPLIDLAERTTFGYESLARSGSTDYRNPLHLLKAAKEAREIDPESIEKPKKEEEEPEPGDDERNDKDTENEDDEVI